MKRIMISFAAAVAAVGCSGGLDLSGDPDVAPAKTVSVYARIASLSEEFVWSEGRAIGVYGSSKGLNAKYVPSLEYVGKSGEAILYGPEVDGELIAYFPYQEDGCAAAAQGRMPFPEIQQYHSTAAAHLAGNSVMVARAKDGHFDLSYRTGLIHFSVDIENEGEVKSLRLSSGVNLLYGNFSIDSEATEPVTDGGHALTMRGLGKPEGEFDVWFALPAGSYEALQLTVVTDKREVTKPVNGIVPVRAGEVTEMTVIDEAYEYTGGDLGIISGIFDR